MTKTLLKMLFPLKSNHKSRVVRRISIFCMALGLVAQIFIIIGSFYWPENQPNNPIISSFTYIVFTFGCMVAYGSYLFLVLFTVLFFFTFHGVPLFINPAFYYLSGIVLYLSSWTILTCLSNKEGEKERIENKYVYYDAFDVTIAHEKVSNLAETSYYPGSSYQTWNVSKAFFTWSYVRPEHGIESFSKECPFCGKNLEIKNVSSIENLKSEYALNSKISILSTFTLTILIFCIISLSLTPNIPILFKYLICPLIAMITFFVAISSFNLLLNAKSPYCDSGIASGIAPGDLQSKHISGPYNQHYVVKTEGHMKHNELN